MTAKTNAERKAEERQRRKAEGLTRLELWAAKAHHERIKAYAKKLALRR